MDFFKKITSIALLINIALAPILVAEQDSEKTPLLTHADAAVILAKYTGLFDRYVSEDAALSECVSFLNQTGVYFGLMELVNGKDFTLKDCARVMGQVELVFTGEAAYLAGKVKLPKNIDTWEDFCIMSGVDYVEGYRTINQTLQIMVQQSDS